MQHITEAQVWAAYKPLLDLLGVSPFELYLDPPLTVTRDDDNRVQVKFWKSIDPAAAVEDWPTVAVGVDPEVQELAYEVTLTADGSGFDLNELWPDGYRPSTRMGSDV